MVMDTPLTPAQRAALQRLRDQHTDAGFPPELNELLTEPTPSWVGNHHLGHRAHLDLDPTDHRFLVQILLHDGSASSNSYAPMTADELTKAIELLTAARDSLV